MYTFKGSMTECLSGSIERSICARLVLPEGFSCSNSHSEQIWDYISQDESNHKVCTK